MNSNTKTELNLGYIAVDKITGFEGVIVGITQWVDGRRTYVLQSRDKQDRNKQPTELTAFDEYRLEVEAGQDEPFIPVAKSDSDSYR